MQNLMRGLWSLALLGASACDDAEHSCDLVLRSTPRGEIHDEDGNPITATRVLRSVLGHGDERCSVRRGGYFCPEQPGLSTLKVFLGEREWSKMVFVKQDENGCHAAYLTVDFTLDGAHACPPAVAVEGELLNLFPRDAVPELTLTRETDAPASFLISQACSIDGTHYACPALDTYAPADYALRVEDGRNRVVTVHVDGSDCMPNTQHLDLDLSR